MEESQDAGGGQGISMQQVILRLQEFWAGRGALIAQPFNTEVGAGTANPATALRVLGPEPWIVAYVEPSVRPDDARYGENPNRLQTHTQFQVILKPAPPDPQEIYLESLAALGVDVAEHDVRFIEDNWASPALGAWGLGWEVWLDGLEITQFTYFQQAGGLTLNPISVELTYGLERIVMALQGKRHFTEIQYNDHLSYGDVYLQTEYEMSRYYLDDADVELNRRLFADFAAEARRLLEAKLPVAAYTYVLKCSHAFNVLDARGAISTTERARSFGLMRQLTKDSSQLWVARREELGFPLGVPENAPEPSPEPLPDVTAHEPLLIEIGFEELPWADVRRATATVRAAVEGVLADTSLEHGPVVVKATPRRVVVMVESVAPMEADRQVAVRGPKVAAAYDEEGAPTQALEGFLRGQGATLHDVITIRKDSAEHVAVQRTIAGRNSPGVAAAAATAAVRALHADRNMRWGDPELSYSRPVRWLLVFLGEHAVSTVVSRLKSDVQTRLQRTSTPQSLTITSARGYEELLASHDIVLDREVRRERVVSRAREAAASVDGHIDANAEAGLIDEITDIVEDPRVVLGSFEPRFLELPQSVLSTVMRKHQRYLPVLDANGRLLPNFVTFANGACNTDLVRAGNESVIRARYEDASFFWQADLAVLPQTFRSRLVNLAFEERLGSLDNRVGRIARLSESLSETACLSEAERGVVRRAAQLNKFDLASQMVVELSSLAGTMARIYAERAGESPAVAQALEEAEMPRTSTSELPTTRPGAIVALADRADLLTGMYAIGAIPSGTSDPYGVRRAAIGLIRILRAFPEFGTVSVRELIARAADELAEFGVETPDGVVDQAAAFVALRYEQLLLDSGTPHNLVRAVLPLADQPARADAALAELATVVGDARGPALIGAIQRAQRILPPVVEGFAEQPEPTALLEPAEQRLVDVLDHLENVLADRHAGPLTLLELAGALPPSLEEFFDNVRVLDDDPAVRTRRLALVIRVVALGGLLDWSVL